jgi:hypothetical protein
VIKVDGICIFVGILFCSRNQKSRQIGKEHWGFWWGDKDRKIFIVKTLDVYELFIFFLETTFIKSLPIVYSF